MMRQDVNFLQPDLRPIVTPWRWGLAAGAVFLLAAILFLYHMEGEVERLQQQVALLNQQVMAGKKKVQGIKNSPLVEAVALNGKTMETFHAIANHTMAGVWLTRMQVKAGRVTLEGRATQTSKPLDYVRTLGEKSVFARGWRFSSVAVSPATDDKNSFNFQVTGERVP
ncbi:MAG: PilN domain-containing protein [Magnetococcales bacterium]|nr:PilN domain-containing protein [Magnetococcales bacterium]NGZ26704.1 PilN domain-containing protein [Magnetococcales bacterium]